MAAGDAAQVLTVLGDGRVNLLGGSYGATAAQVFQQLFPGRVRTMTLLSGSLLSVPLFEWFPRASQQALDRAFARCASDPSSAMAAFPHLAAEWARLRASVAVRPVTLPARRSPTGAAIRLDSGSAWPPRALDQLLMMSASTAAYLPLLIHSLAVARDKRAAVAMIAGQLITAGLVSSGGDDSVIGYPIRCAEPWARLRPGQVSGRGSYYGPYWEGQARWWQYVCTLIPAPGAAADGHAANPPASPY